MSESRKELKVQVLKHEVDKSANDTQGNQRKENERCQKTRPFSYERTRPFNYEDANGELRAQASTDLPVTHDQTMEKITDTEIRRTPLISPMKKISDDAAMKAEAIVAEIPLPEEAKKTLERYLAQAMTENPEAAKYIGSAMAVAPWKKRPKGMNFSLALKKIKKYFRDTEDGERVKNFYCIEIHVFKKNGKVKIFEAEVEDCKVKGIDWLKKATGSLAQIPGESKAKHLYEEMVQDCIEAENVSLEIQYPNAGWRNIPQIGWRYVYGNGVIGTPRIGIHTDSSYSLNIQEENLGTQETFACAFEMMNLCARKSVSHSLWLYIHAALLTTVFKLAGYPLNFVFIIQGVTNSRKTSLVTAVAKLFDRENLTADAEFATATACGIEKTVSRYKDAPVLIDDFKPGATLSQQREMEQKLDELVRLYGNRVEKKRMTDFTPRGEEKFFPVGGGCILTAEVLTGVSSTLTRTFVVEINNGDVNNDLLNFYQTQRWILPTYAYDFLTWVTEGFQGVVEYIRQHFPQWRKAIRFQYARYAEMYATFCCVGGLLAQYTQDRGFWNKEQAEQFLEETRN